MLGLNKREGTMTERERIRVKRVKNQRRGEDQEARTETMVQVLQIKKRTRAVRRYPKVQCHARMEKIVALKSEATVDTAT